MAIKFREARSSEVRIGRSPTAPVQWLVSLGLFVASVASGQSHSGRIVGYVPYESGSKQVLIFQLQGAPVSGCNTTGRFAIDSDSPRFKGTFAAVLASHHTQSDVKVLYAPTCNAWVNSWDATAVCVGSMSSC